MIPELYRSFETSTLKGLVSYGDPLDEESRTESRGKGDEEGSPRGRVPGRGRRYRSSLGRRRRWLRLGWRLLTRRGSNR